MKNDKKNNFDYIRSYNEKNYKRIELKVRLDNKKVIDKLSTVKSKNAYILDLIEKDIEKNK